MVACGLFHELNQRLYLYSVGAMEHNPGNQSLSNRTACYLCYAGTLQVQKIKLSSVICHGGEGGSLHHPQINLPIRLLGGGDDGEDTLQGRLAVR